MPNSLEVLNLASPPLATQRRIAALLTALDDKIELNRRMNETLEGIAGAVWGEWFGEQDGEEVALKDFIQIKHGYAFKGENITDEETENILVTPGNFRVGGGFHEKKFKYFNAEFPAEYILDAGKLIVTMTDLSRDGDTLGYPAFVPEWQEKTFLHNQRIGLIEFKDSLLGRHFLYELLKTEAYRSFVLGSATGSTVRHTSPSRICDFKFLLPMQEEMKSFEMLAEGIQKRIQSNDTQSRTLTALRDALLPRLMSGGLEI